MAQCFCTTHSEQQFACTAELRKAAPGSLRYPKQTSPGSSHTSRSIPAPTGCCRREDACTAHGLGSRLDSGEERWKLSGGPEEEEEEEEEGCSPVESPRSSREELSTGSACGTSVGSEW